MNAALLHRGPRCRRAALLPVRRHRQQGAELLGITGYGFAPLRLPADLDFAPMFHGIDERVPVESLQFGTRVLLRLLETC